jgi:hypothetical protein
LTSTTKRTELRYLLFLTLVFVASRLILHAVGLRWDGTFLQWGWQALDVELMRTRLLESLWYLHGQPPGMNLMIGVFVKISPNHYQEWLQASFWVEGLVIHLGMWHLLRKLGIRIWIALAVTLLFMLSPSSIVFEAWLFYEHPTVMLLMVAAVLLFRFMDTRRLAWGVGFFTTLLMIVLTRSIFQWFWFVAALLALLYFCQRDRKVVLKAAALPTALLVLFLVKNWVLFGFWGTSSWSGMNLAKIVLQNEDDTLRQEAARAGEIPLICTYYPFAPVVENQSFLPMGENPHKGIPVLDSLTSHGVPNFNHYSYVQVSKEFAKGCKWWILHHPDRYLKRVEKASRYYFQPASSYYWMGGHVMPMSTYARVYNHAVLGCLQDPDEVRENAWASWPLSHTLTYSVLVAHGGVLLLSLILFWKRRKRLRVNLTARHIVFAFLLGTSAYLLLLGNTTEMGENMRFRFLTHGYGWVLVAFTAEWIAARCRELIRRRKASHS